MTIAANSEEDIFETEDECSDEYNQLFRDVLQLCADWFFEAKTEDRILNGEDFQCTFNERIKEIDRRCQEIDKEQKTSISDDIFDMVQEIYNESLLMINHLFFLKGCLIGIESASEFDNEYGVGFSKFINDAFDEYIEINNKSN